MMINNSNRPLPPAQRKLPERHSAKERGAHHGDAHHHHHQSHIQTPQIDPEAIRSEDDILAQLSRSHRAQKLAMEEIAHLDDGNAQNAKKPNGSLRMRAQQRLTARGTTPSKVAQRLAIALIFAVILIVADQVSKIIIREYLYRYGTNVLPITSYFALVSAWNPGVSFGFFSTSGATGDFIFKLLDIVVSVYLLWRVAITQNFWQNCASVLIMGGAMGNFFDRLNFGAVFDFLLFHIGEWRYPAFNLADSWITLGVVIMMLDWMFGYDDEATDAKK
ncbi:MAG: signal peptidase II [Alphaproteobacteria bacterium]|nr:signal peptidase II [Alphaproteobacteria bacterium]